MPQAIAYTRVSTAEQGKSGLGLAAQQASIEQFCKSEGFDIIRTFTEIETGKGHDALERRPQLRAALAAARKAKCHVIVSKLDRLARDVHFVSGLMVHKAPFIVAQLGREVEPFMLHIYASVAEQERNLISTRTKEGLAQAKARGVKLGHPRIDEIVGKGVAAVKAQADQVAERVLPIIEGVQARGITTARGIGAELERLQVRTSRGGTSWSASQVQNVLKRKKED
jgi:DNA invertase Pin-like site-specific DNA recombinase